MKKLSPEAKAALKNILNKLRKETAEDFKNWHGRPPAPAFYSDEKGIEAMLYAIHLNMLTLQAVNFDRRFIIDSLNYGSFLNLDASARVALAILAMEE